MNWELYEVWGIFEDDTEELIETTKSLKEAKAIAKLSLEDDAENIVECVIYYEDENGNLVEVESVSPG
jgi:hypothetical protein